ncbi:unnamed protein product [Arctogadus glacialis]
MALLKAAFCYDHQALCLLLTALMKGTKAAQVHLLRCSRPALFSKKPITHVAGIMLPLWELEHLAPHPFPGELGDRGSHSGGAAAPQITSGVSAHCSPPPEPHPDPGSPARKDQAHNQSAATPG